MLLCTISCTFGVFILQAIDIKLELFEKTQKYSIQVWECRHPLVLEYVIKVLQSIKQDLQKGRLSKLFFTIMDESDTELERFTFEIAHMMNDIGSYSVPADIHGHFRAFVLKLSCIDMQLKPNPPNSKFSIHIEINGDNPVPTSQIGWIAQELGVLDHAALYPIKAMDIGLLRMQMFAEESELKNSQLTQSSVN